MPNATHRKRLARAYARQTGITYMAAYDAVMQASIQGWLPSRLDDAGMLAALRILDTSSSAVPAVIAAAIDAATSSTHRPKIASDPRDQQIYDLSAVYEHLSGKQGLLYISSPGSGKDKYVFGGGGGGHVCLGREEALAHITGLVNSLGPMFADRNPYVGEGADGARRSAQIDREEADGLDRDDPRYAEALASADRWEQQARRLDPGFTRSPSALDGECQHVNTEYRAQDGSYCTDCGEALASFEQLKAAEAFYLERSSLRRLREVWQGRVTLTAMGRDRTRFTIDDTPASDLKNIELRWLAGNGYVEARLAQGEEWVVARPTAFGDDVLAVNGADQDKFRDGLPPEATTTRTDAVIADVDVSETLVADVRSLLRVRDVFEKGGRLEWWWHLGDFAGSHGFKIVIGVDPEDGAIILRDEDPGWIEPVTRLSLDYIDRPDQAAQHLFWPDHSGVIFRDRNGTPDATYRIALPPPGSTSEAHKASSTVAPHDSGTNAHPSRSTPSTTTNKQHKIDKVHKARPAADDEFHCEVCFQRIRKVPGGHGTTFVHADTGAVAAAGPDSGRHAANDSDGSGAATD